MEDDGKMEVKASVVSSYLTCPLCAGYFRNAMSLRECLHTFCNGCIQHYFEDSSVEHSNCPVCNVWLGTQPWKELIHNPVFQDLADKLLPKDEDEYEQRKQFVERLGLKRKRSSTPQSIRQPMTDSDNASRKPTIRFTLSPLDSPNEPITLRLPPLKTQRMCTEKSMRMDQLTQYLHAKLHLKKNVPIDILCRGKAVGQESSLEFIDRTIWKNPNDIMELHYRRRP